MTIIQIPASEKETYEQSCAIVDLKVSFYTQENNSEMVTMEVDTDSANVMHCLTKIACEFLAVKRRINQIIK